VPLLVLPHALWGSVAHQEVTNDLEANRKGREAGSAHRDDATPVVVLGEGDAKLHHME
jgi:hypothetical protein